MGLSLYMQLSMTSSSAEHASKAPRRLPRHRHSCSSALVCPCCVSGKAPPLHPWEELLGGCLGQVTGARFFPHSSLAVNAAQPRMPGLAHQLRASLSPHSAKPSCLPQFMTVKPTSSNSCFPFSVFLLQNCSGGNAMTLISYPTLIIICA